MFNYSQPDFYHFSEDSIILSEIGHDIFLNLFKSDKDEVIFVDGFSGSGVVGLEFLFLLKNLKMIRGVEFIEKNKKMIGHCKLNVSKFKLGKPDYPPISIRNEDFFDLGAESFNSGSLLFFLLNPPFFISNPTRGSKNIDRRNARFFDEGFSILNVLLKIDELSVRFKTSGLVLFRVDQVPESFWGELPEKLKRIKVSELEDLRFNKLTRLIYWES